MNGILFSTEIWTYNFYKIFRNNDSVEQMQLTIFWRSASVAGLIAPDQAGASQADHRGPTTEEKLASVEEAISVAGETDDSNNSSIVQAARPGAFFP